MKKLRTKGVRRGLTVLFLSLAIALSIVFIIIGAQEARGWGWTTHRFIADEAVNVFSDGSFFSAHRATISNYSIMPDQWKSSDSYERYRHWYHVDEPEGENEYYRGGLPNNWSILDEGVLPWAVEDNFASLVQSLEDEDWERAAQLMGAISHYTEDATNPLHATSDHSPGGKHGSYESEVNGRLDEISIPEYVPQELENIFEATMATLEGSFNFTDEDPEGGVNLSDFLEQGILWNDTIRDITENRLRASVQFTANFWYTAMIQAGLTIQAPTLLEPEAAFIATSTPTFTWTPANGANVYDFQLASDVSFTSDVITIKDLPTTSYTLENSLARDKWYWWRVRSGDNSTHVGIWSQIQWFTVNAGVENYQVSVSISPSYQSGLPGETLTYTVTVTNTSNVPDTYTLENMDNAGWTLNIPSTVGPLSPDTSENVTLSVTIPGDALGGTTDNVTVTVTSQTDDTVENSASCTAHTVITREVEVSISPENQSALPGENVSFTVTVINLGDLPDNFDLTVSDDAGWAPSLLDNLLENVQPGENRTTTVSVTVPSDATENESTQITITATSRADSSVSASDTCTAVAGKKPEPVSGFPVIPVAISAIIAIIACLAVYRIYWAGR